MKVGIFMENNNKTINIYTSEQFGQVRTILNDDGSISINAEDVSIGLGWFEEKMGKNILDGELLMDL